MKTQHPIRAAASILLATIVLSAFAGTSLAAPPDEQPIITELADNRVDSDIAASGQRQLAAGNAAYARGDFAEAFHQYRNIAILGYAEAHYRLGVMYREGQGVRKNQRLAEYWLKHAAAQGYPGAAEALTALARPPQQG